MYKYIVLSYDSNNNFSKLKNQRRNKTINYASNQGLASSLYKEYLQLKNKTDNPMKNRGFY